MNRQMRRAMKAKTGRLARPVPGSVTLVGGPMAGWVVKPDAPALREDWWRTWPASTAAAWSPGRYVRGSSFVVAQEARWEAIPQA